MNLLVLLQMAADVNPGRIAFTCGEQSLTYQALYEASSRAAKLFSESGCDYVSMLDVSSLATPIALFGAAAAGVPYVPLNYRLTDAEIEALSNRVQPMYLIGDATRLRQLSLPASAVQQSASQFLISCTEGSPVELADPWGIDADRVAVQLFTSGTTGAPKAALLRHRNLAAYILGSLEFGSADERETILVSVPPYHIAGISALLSSVYLCRRVVFLPTFSPRDWLDECANNRVTNAFVVPTMLSRIIDELKSSSESRWDLSSLRALAYGGGKMPQAVIEEALTRFPDVAFTNAYGLTETSSTITLLTPEDHRTAIASSDPKVRRRLASVGKPLPAVEIAIFDEDGNPCPPGVSGEIYVRGEQIAGEYREKGSLLNAEGWFPTRDAGYLDDDGFLFLDGRADDVIVRGGENISPGEIEDVLTSHPAVADAAVVGIASQEWGETVAAAVVLVSGEELDAGALQALVKDKLRSSRVPEVIGLYNELPYNEMGKLLRRLLKPELQSLYNKNSQVA